MIMGSMMKKRFTSVGVAAGVVLLLTACAPKVGSEKWCQQIEAKAKDEITLAEAKDYAKHCILRKTQ